MLTSYGTNGVTNLSTAIMETHALCHVCTETEIDQANKKVLVASCQKPVGLPWGTCNTRSTKMPGVTT
jgi:hypothetical protein